MFLDMNTRMTRYEDEIRQLKAENRQLNLENRQLRSDFKAEIQDLRKTLSDLPVSVDAPQKTAVEQCKMRPLYHFKT